MILRGGEGEILEGDWRGIYCVMWGGCGVDYVLCVFSCMQQLERVFCLAREMMALLHVARAVRVLRLLCVTRVCKQVALLKG